ncbi:VP1 [Gokushovirus WZ-2015a]|nr:VP1 [Gokushovirus WZ-2015a]
MDNIYLDTYYFFVPNRLVWQHWKEFNGENTQSAWLPSVDYEVPQLVAPAETGWNVGSVADYLGVPTGVPNISVNALPFRAYALICNEWFRDQNLTDPLLVPVDDATVQGVNTGNYITDVVKGGLPFKAAKYHDYYTSCLPAPQKGPDVTIPVATAGNLPVVPMSDVIPRDKFSSPLSAWVLNPSGFDSNNQDLTPVFTANSGTVNNSLTQNPNKTLNTFGGSARGEAVFNNLWALNDGNAAAATINQLRFAFQVQKLYERDARGGTRYIEILKSHFGVTSPDSRLQRPEYLGGNRVPIQVNQIIQQSGTVAGSAALGSTAGMSLTTDIHDEFTKSFTEHGFVIGLMVARYPHTYQQGLERMWSRKTRFDYYWPVFANIGEQAVLNKEIFAQGTAEDDEVFGYQEAWADYRYKPNRVSGEMRSSATASLDVWHLADDYSKLPALSDEWIREDKSNVDRSLVVQSSVSNQLFGDIYVRNICTRPMPMYSVPGLIDHH